MTVSMEILRSSLPAGLTVWTIGNENEKYMQRADYQILLPTFECKKEQNVAVQSKERERTRERIPNLLQQLASYVEDMYPTFPFHMKRATDAYLKEKLLEFVMSDAGNTVLGPKKCREVVAYLGTQMLQKHEPFFILCSFLLDARVVVEHQVFTWNHQTYASEVVFRWKMD